jgi:YD repeat-containing protein
MAVILVTGLLLQGAATSIAQASTVAARPAPGHTPSNPTVPRNLKSATRLTKSHSGFVVTPVPSAKSNFYKGASTSTSPNPSKAIHKVVGGGPARPKEGHDPTLTFSEHSGTITNQYESDGILFAGDSEDSNVAPYITGDGADPTSPALSGGGGFGSDIVGEFVVPGTTTPATVDGFSLDVGGIDTAGSTRVEVFGPGGQLVGVIVANEGGGVYNAITSNYADVAYFVVTGDDPAGWAVDNLSYIAGTVPTKAPKTVGTGASSVHSSTCTHSITKGDPVDCASGDFYHTFTDVSVPGRGPALDLTRTYNSLDAATEGIFGYGWTSSYQSNLVVNEDSTITITEADGSQVTATPDGSDFTLPSWADSTLVQNEDGTYTFVRQQTETYTFNSSGQLTAITDLNGYPTTLSYTSGKLTTVTDPDGRTITVAYGDNELVSEVTDPDSQHTTYAYDDSGDLTSVTGPLDRVTSFTYDDNHLMLTMTMPNGQSGGPDAGDTYTNTYNGSDQVLTQTDPDGLETTYAYSGDNFSDSGGTTTITDPHGDVETENYIDGQLQTLVKGGLTWDYAFDQNTLGESSSINPEGQVTSTDYDADGNVLTSVDAEGNATTYTYNGFNEPLTVTDPMGIVTTSTYDDNGNVETKVVTGTGGTPTATTD